MCQGECRSRTIFDLPEDPKPEPMGEVNKWMDQPRQKMIQYMWPLLLQAVYIGCEVRRDGVRGEKTKRTTASVGDWLCG